MRMTAEQQRAGTGHTARADEARGEVASIKRYMVHDGPGIRSVVFLKGCPLRCLWCSSPQTWSESKNVIYRAKKCIACGSCIPACQEMALSSSASGGVSVDRGRCTQCGKCVEACPTAAIDFDSRTMSVSEVMQVLERDHAYYAQSGGGVTFSGGEPTLQSTFLLGLLKACKAAGIHTAIETTGCVERGVLEGLLPWIDLMLYDVKHLDPVRHEELTGKRNETILANLDRIAAAGTPAITIHVPLIPGHNDSDQFLDALARYLQRVGILDVEFLPFHKLGSHEYDEMGQRYPLEELEGIPVGRMTAIQERFRALGFRVAM